jgi:hypothetical protein
MLAFGSGAAEERAKIGGALEAELERRGGHERVPVYFVMAERPPVGGLLDLVETWRNDERRAFVPAVLREHAARTQVRLLERLRAAAAAGRADRIESNWLGNFVSCRAEPGVVAEAVLLPEVLEARWTPERRIEELTDAPPPEEEPPPPVEAAGEGVARIQAPAAWARGFRGATAVVCNIDSGANYRHPDLARRVWVNPDEIPGNGHDDDGNGRIDDVHGWNFVQNAPDPYETTGHGTNTSGVLVGDGACGTETGVAPRARVMVLACLDEASTWNAAQYAVLEGAHVISSSLSFKVYFTPPPDYALHRDVNAALLAAGIVRVNSTSNDGGTCPNASPLAPRPFNVAAPACVPAPWIHPDQAGAGGRGGVLGVAALGAGDPPALAFYSPCGPFAWSLAELRALLPGYPYAATWPAAYDDHPWQWGVAPGLIKPDVGAPTSVVTTGSGVQCPVAYVGGFAGTSAATPHVGGVLALARDANPSLAPEDLAMIAQVAVDPTGTPGVGKENHWGAGLVNALAAVELAGCVHKRAGVSAWARDQRIGTELVLSVDGLGGRAFWIALGLAPGSFEVPGVLRLGLAPPFGVLAAGVTDTAGDAAVRVGIPAIPGLDGVSIYTQVVLDDRAGPHGRLLASNVLRTTFRP